jgi:transmembrane sensor
MSAEVSLREQIAAEAAEWFARLQDPGEGQAARESFAEWLLRSPAHIEEFLAVTRIWGDMHAPDREEFSADRLVADSLASARHGNVVPLKAMPGVAATPERPRSDRGSRNRLVATAASLLVVFVAGGAWWWQVDRVPTYVTEVGEQRSVTLPDGSLIELNARSRVRVRYSGFERAVDLLEGQGFFRVARDARRPFVVYSLSDRARVRAVGTAFDVYQTDGGTIVTVLEGKVQVDSASSGSGEPVSDDPSVPDASVVPLVAGESIVVTAGQLAEPTPANSANAIAWTQRQIVFESASLEDVAREFNRYNSRRLVVRAGELLDFRVSGVFPSTDPTSLLRFLREQPGIAIEETEDEIRIGARERRATL